MDCAAAGSPHRAAASRTRIWMNFFMSYQVFREDTTKSLPNAAEAPLSARNRCFACHGMAGRFCKCLIILALQICLGAFFPKQTTHLAHPQKLPETACLNPRTILLFASFSATHAGNYCVVTFAERRPRQHLASKAALLLHCPLRPCRADAARENPPEMPAASVLTGRSAHSPPIAGTSRAG